MLYTVQSSLIFLSLFKCPFAVLVFSFNYLPDPLCIGLVRMKGTVLAQKENLCFEHCYINSDYTHVLQL